MTVDLSILKEIRARHKRRKYTDGYGCAWCGPTALAENEDAPTWPCDTVRLLRLIEDHFNHAW